MMKHGTCGRNYEIGVDHVWLSSGWLVGVDKKPDRDAY